MIHIILATPFASQACKKGCKLKNRPVHNEPSADNAGGFRKLAFTKPANYMGKEKKQQVKSALRLPAGR